jgi:PGF-pre-PGF domain-containing protein
MEVNLANQNLSFNASAAAEMKNKATVITIYGIPYYPATPTLRVKLENGTVRNASHADAGVSGIIYAAGPCISGNCYKLTFDASHFTDFTIVSKTALRTAIKEAVNLISTTTRGTGVGQYSVAAGTAMNDSLKVAQGYNASVSAIQSKVDATRANLTNKIAVYKGTLKVNTTTQIKVNSTTAETNFSGLKTTIVVNGTGSTGNMQRVTVPSNISTTTQVKLDLSSLVNQSNNGTKFVVVGSNLNLTRESGSSSTYAQVQIPAGTEIKDTTGTWNGTLIMPTTKLNSSVSLTTSGYTNAVEKVIELGFVGERLRFTKAVRILLSGQGGKKAGYTVSGSTLTEITSTCSADTQVVGDALAADSECKITVGSDLVIWTKHFTSFAAFTQTAVSTTTTTTVSSSSGGGSLSTSTEPKSVSTGALWDTASAGDLMVAKLSGVEVTRIELTPKNSLRSAELTVTSLGVKPSTSVPLSEKAFKYLQIEKKNIASTDFDSADITFKVNKSWMTANSVSDVALFRYVDSWVQLDTVKVTEDATSITYKATTPGFSYFAIAEVAQQTPQTTTTVVQPVKELETPAAEKQPKPATTTTQKVVEATITPPVEPSSGSSRWIWVAVLIVLVAVAAFFMIRKKPEHHHLKL